MTSPIVSVRGQAVLEAEPELAVITITVTARGSDRRSTVDLLSARGRAVAEVIRRFEDGIERSETSRLHVYPELRDKKTEKVRRYVGHISISLTVHDFAVLSDLLVGASEVELVSVDGPAWGLRPTSDVYRQARLAAARDAMARARDYAEAFSAEVIGVIEIADQGMSQQHAVPAAQVRFASMALSGGSDGGPEFQIDPGLQEIHGQVEARFLISEPDLSAILPPIPLR